VLILLLFLCSAQYQAVMRLLAASQLINQAVGDALSGLLLVEVILQYKGWSFQNWCEIYSDLPSRQLKARILCVKYTVVAEGLGSLR
jgi:phosphoacetylglucosamine mutase